MTLDRPDSSLAGCRIGVDEREALGGGAKWMDCTPSARQLSAELLLPEGALYILCGRMFAALVNVYFNALAIMTLEDPIDVFSRKKLSNSKGTSERSMTPLDLPTPESRKISGEDQIWHESCGIHWPVLELLVLTTIIP